MNSHRLLSSYAEEFLSNRWNLHVHAIVLLMCTTSVMIMVIVG